MSHRLVDWLTRRRLLNERYKIELTEVQAYQNTISQTWHSTDAVESCFHDFINYFDLYGEPNGQKVLHCLLCIATFTCIHCMHRLLSWNWLAFLVHISCMHFGTRTFLVFICCCVFHSCCCISFVAVCWWP